MNFLRKIFSNSIYKELLQKIFLSKNKLKYSLVDFDNSYNNNFSNDKNYNFLILNRENDRDSSNSRQNSTRNSSTTGRNSESSRRTSTTARTSSASGQNSSNSSSNRINSQERNKASNRTKYSARATTSRKEKDSSDDSISNLENSMKRQVRLPSFAFRDKVKQEHQTRINNGGGYTSAIREVIQQNRKHREEQAQRLQSVKTLDSEDLGNYLDALSHQVEGKGIVNSQLKVLTIMIFALIVIMLVVGTFLNKNNPLVPLLASINKPLSIKIVDNQDVKIFETKRETRTLTYASNISQNLENTFIALHALNELIYQKAKNQAQAEKIPIESIKVDQDYINYLILEYRNYVNSPRESIFRANTSIFGTISDVVFTIPNKLLDWANNLFMGKSELDVGFEMKNEFDPRNQPLTPDNKIDTYYINELAKTNNNVFAKNDFYVINGCKIFKSPEDVSSPACEFSYINIIMTKMYQADNSGFFAHYINPIKDYLLINWLKEKISLSNFFELFFNMTYFGNYQMGLKSSFVQYFEKVSPDTMDVPHALFIIKHLYEDNKNYYPSYNITMENVLDMMIANDYVPEDLREDILDELKKVEKSAKIPRTSYSIYLDQLFLAGYEHFPASYDITVKTTFSNALQNSLSSMLADQLKKNNIPEGSAIIINKNQLLVGITITMVDGKIYYISKYPDVYVYNSIKPFMYLTLLNNKKDVPSQLLNANYQNLIFSNKRLDQFVKPVSNPNLVVLNEDIPITINDLDIIESKDLAIIPSGIKKRLAERLTYLENNFFTNATPKDYEEMLNRLRIKAVETPINMPDLLNGDTRVNLYNLVRSYTAFQEDSSIIDSKIIGTINGNLEDKHDAKKLLEIRKTYANMLKNIYFNTILSPKGESFYIMIDFQTAIVFNDNYILALWLGSMDGNKKYKDTTENLELLVRNVLNLLQQ